MCLVSGLPVKPTARWRTQASVYTHWQRYLPELDWSESAARAMYEHESRGTPLPAPMSNGYAWGKRWTNWQVTAWREGIADGVTTPHELRTDPTLHPAMVAMVLGRNAP